MPRRPSSVRHSADRFSFLFPLYLLLVGLFAVMQIFFLHELERMDHASDLIVHTTGEQHVPPESISANRTKFLAEQQVWPDIETVIDKKSGHIIGDPQFLLDFAILGFEKCGTSTLMKWLGGHPEIQCFQNELYDLFQGHPDALVTRIYKKYGNRPGEKTLKIGYKNPIDIFQPSSRNLLGKYWPRTKLFILLRHPVRYFESLYNFRIQNLVKHENATFLKYSPLDRIDVCKAGFAGVCTEHANYAAFLYRLGKTRFMTTSSQTTLLEESPLIGPRTNVTMQNPIFVIEMTQFADEGQQEQLKRDLTSFLELQTPLEAPVPHAKPGRQWPKDETFQAEKDRLKIDICQEQYAPLRTALMKAAVQSSNWILESFVALPDVTVSSPFLFEQAVLEWKRDPCEETTQAK